MSIRNALKWSFLSELAVKAIQPVIFIVLARLLTPEDFGVMNAALMVIAFSQIFWEAGLSKALIQRQTDIDAAATITLVVNILMGLVLAGVLFISAKAIAISLFHDSRVENVLKVMTLQIILGAVSSVHVALLQKDMLFKKLFWVRFSTISLPGFVSIPLALIGLNYWALVAGTIFGQLIQMIMLWKVSSWRPRHGFNFTIAPELCRFGAWVALSGLLTWFYTWSDAFIIGYFLSSHELGLYRTGNQFTILLFAIFFAPITPVLYSHLSRYKNSREKIRMTSERLIKLLPMLAIPLGFLLSIFATQIEQALFGPDWEGIGHIIRFLAVMHTISWIVGMNGEIYRAIGRPSLETIVTGLFLVIYLAGYLISIRYGLTEFLWARVFLAATATAFHLFLLAKVTSIRFSGALKYLAILAVACLVCYPYKVFIGQYLSNSWAYLLLGGLSTAVIFAAIVGIFAFKQLKEDVDFILSETNDGTPGN